MSHMIYLYIAPMLVACLLFAAGCATVLSSKRGGHPRTNYWNKIFSGLGYLCLTGQSALVMPYLQGSSMLLTLVAAIFFALLGVFLLSWGLKMRKESLTRK